MGHTSQDMCVCVCVCVKEGHNLCVFAGAKTLFAGSSCNDVVTRGARSVTILCVTLTPEYVTLPDRSGIISAHFDKRIRFWDLRYNCSMNSDLHSWHLLLQVCHSQ